MLWTEGKRQRERRATTLARAKEVAQEEAARLWTEGEEPAGARTPFGALVSVATDPRYRSWTDEWASRVDAIARIHIMPSLGAIPASQVTRQHVAALLHEMADAGYSHHFIKHTRNVFKLAVDEGIQRGMWEASRHPLVQVTVPPSHTGSDDGRPDLTMVPTDNQVNELIVRMATTRPVYGVMAATAAYTGIRWGELLALTVASVDLTRSRLRITQNCVESNSGRFSFRPPAKRKARTREVVIEAHLADVLAVWIAELSDDWQPGPHIDGPSPGRALFSTENGNPFRRSAHSKVFWRHADRVPGWPPDATWHYLRHYAATRWIRLRVEVPTVSTMLGHSQISTTYDWYVDVDADALHRAANTLA
ncbi:hypothetical protein BH23ACT5_BH23ACT5_14740 [soil metagenome]